MTSVLLVDDDLELTALLAQYLRSEGFDAHAVHDGELGAAYVTHNLEEAARLADRIVVLSRRPGRVREIVTIPLTRVERGDVNAREKLLALQNELWSLIRGEAIDAEREVVHA